MFVAGLGVPARRRRPVPPAQRAGRQHVRQGRATPSPRSRPAATSSSPRAPRPAATPVRSPPWPLVPQIVDAVGDQVPVVAAGGIFDGRGLAAALALGADGVWVGTRFIATPEARAVPGYKDALLRTCRGRHRRHPRPTPARPAGSSRNPYTQDWEERADELQPLPDAGHQVDEGRRQPPRRRPSRPRASTPTASSTRRPGRRRHRRAGAGRRARAPLRRRGRGRAARRAGRPGQLSSLDATPGCPGRRGVGPRRVDRNRSRS